MRRAFALAYRVLGHREDAEDLVQDAFYAAITKIHQFEKGRPFGPWLMRIVFNRGLNQRKARALRKTEEIPESTPVAGASPLDAAERRELRETMTAALAELPERRRMIVELFDLEGFSGPEIAEILDMPEGTVRWELHQARGALRAKLQTLSKK
jgi:RNA polymerase sigma-70 factor, ECF subfamily